MDRRTFIATTALGALSCASTVTSAQPVSKAHRIGFLTLYSGPNEWRFSSKRVCAQISRRYRPCGASHATVPMSAGRETSRISSVSEVAVSLWRRPPGM